MNCNQQSSQSFVDFIERCLDWDPQTRITPYEALMHEWVVEGLPPKVLMHHKRMLGIEMEEQRTMKREAKIMNRT
jgi:dual specificity tyrosine-phosphorylation-regulated kinase 2/3/4